MYRHFFSAALLISALMPHSRVGLAKQPDLEFPEGKNQVTIPLQRGGYHLLVPVKINGRDVGLFVVDTGASTTLIDSKYADSLHLPMVVKPAQSDIGIKMEMRAVSELEVGGIKAREVFIIASDLREFRSQPENGNILGVLGNEYFLNCAPFTINWSGAALTMYKDRAPEMEGSTKVSLEKHSTPIAMCTLPGHIRGWFIIDTGSTGNWTLGYEFSRSNSDWLRKLPWQLKRTSDITGGRDYRAVKMDGAEVAGIPIPGSELLYSVAPGGSIPSWASGLVGQSILRKFAITFDYANRSAWFKPDPHNGMPAEWFSTNFDVHAPDADGITPLMRAIQLKRPDFVTRFLDAGAEVNAVESGGRSALHFACEAMDLETVEKLLAAGAVIDNKNALKQTPLSYAAQVGATEIVQLLLAKGAKVENQDVYAHTPLMSAAQGGNKQIVEMLLKAGASVLAMSTKSGTPLCIAAGFGNAEAFKSLLAAGADPARTDRERTPMTVAAATGGSVEIMKLLIDRGVDVNARDSSGRTALFPAAREGNMEMVQLLIEHGVDQSIEDTEHRKAVEYAVSERHKEIAHLLYFETEASTTKPASQPGQ